MGKSVLCLVLVAALAGHVAAQPYAQPQPPAGWVRISLADGRFVDGYVTGGDAVNIFIQTSHGYFSIPRAQIVGTAPISAPAAPPPMAAPAPMPPPPAPIPAPPPPERTGEHDVGARAAGVLYFGMSYAIVAVAASAKRDEDDTATLGFIPVAGPIAWAAKDDEDDFGEDGWDWLAMLGSTTQALGLYLVLGGGKSRDKSKPLLSATTTRDYAGVSLAGRW
jgi:hypothetical protein